MAGPEISTPASGSDPAAAGPADRGLKERRLHDLLRIYIGVFFAVLLLPSIQNLSAVFNGKPLFHPNPLVGVEIPTDRPKFSMGHWTSGKFQKDFEEFYGRVYGLRDYLVRTANELTYMAFGQIPRNENAAVIVGKQQSLITEGYIWLLYGVGKLTDAKLDEYAQRLAKLQTLLAQRGVAFIYLISPSKPSLLPQIIPDAYKVARDPAGDRLDYERMIPLLKRYHIHYVDGHALTADLGKSTGDAMFPQGGIHWNYYAALHTTQAIIAEMESLTGKPMRHLDITSIEHLPEARNSDRDLASLINLWRPERFYGTNPYPKIADVDPPNRFRPNALFVGGSFLGQPVEYLQGHEVVSTSSTSSWYFKEKQAAVLDLLSRDVVVLENNESAIAMTGFGFVESALEVLEKSTPAKQP